MSPHHKKKFISIYSQFYLLSYSLKYLSMQFTIYNRSIVYRSLSNLFLSVRTTKVLNLNRQRRYVTLSTHLCYLWNYSQPPRDFWKNL